MDFFLASVTLSVPCHSLSQEIFPGELSQNPTPCPLKIGTCISEQSTSMCTRLYFSAAVLFERDTKFLKLNLNQKLKNIYLNRTEQGI